MNKSAPSYFIICYICNENRFCQGGFLLDINYETINQMRIAWILLCILMIVAGCSRRSQHDAQDSETDHEDSINDVRDMVSDYYYEDTILVALPGESDDCPDDLVVYGDSLLGDVDRLSLFSNEEGEEMSMRQDIKKAFAELQRYKAGKRKYYPQDAVYDALNSMQYNITFLISHSGVEVVNIFDLFFRLMEQAVRFCPDMNLLSFVCSQDHCLGTLNFYKEYNNIMYYSLMYRKPGGQYGILSIKGNGSKIDHIRLIEETEEYRRYLVSVELSNVFVKGFKVWIVDLYSNGEHRVILPSGAGDITKEWTDQVWIEIRREGNTSWIQMSPEYEHAKIIFSPQYLRWSFCNEKGGIFYPIEHSKSIFLKLYDDEARFSIY